MEDLYLWHGSSQIIEKPLYGAGSEFNDYGKGFYCTEHAGLAKEWACTEQKSGFANHYRLKGSDLRMLNLQDPEYTILHWLALLVTYRKFQPETAVAAQGIAYFREHFYVEVENFDLIRGYRADDSYFSFARAFVGNAISLRQLTKAMYLGELGKQVVVKSKKAFQQLIFLEYEDADRLIFYNRKRRRDEEARAAYKREAMNSDLDGLFMRDILREEIKEDDARLRPDILI